MSDELDVLIRLGENRLRSLYLEENFFSEEIKKEAEQSREEDKIVPLRFFTQLKAIKGYRKQETYTISGVIEIIDEQGEFYPAEVDEKFDGMRAQIHRDKKTVKIFSEDGSEVTSRFPTLVKEVRSLPITSIVLDAEITGWDSGKYKKGNHMNRSDVSGYAHMKSEPDDSKYFANVFDILYLQMPTYESKINEDLHKQPLSIRRKVLERIIGIDHLKHSEKLRLIEIKTAKDHKELSDAIKYFSQEPGSEGAMIKSMKSDYKLTGLSPLWIKFKNEVDLDVEVVDAKKVKGADAYNYYCIIRDELGKPIPVGITYNVSPKTLHMERPLKVGEILRVAFVNLNKYTDPETNLPWFRWWSPRPIEHREDKVRPDGTFTAERIAKATHGQFEKKPYPKEFKGLLDIESEIEFARDYQDPFLIYPSGKKNRFVFQVHIRGRTVHWDDRRQISVDYAVGMTHFSPKGLSRQPKDFEDAKKLYFKEVHPILLEDLKDPKRSLLSGQKELVPIEWLDVEGTIEKKEPGATVNLPGYMIILDKGTIEYGALKPYAHEYFYNGKLVRGKFNDVLIQDKTKWKKVDGEQTAWLWSRSTGLPYVITARAVQKKWMPPLGISALPSVIQKQIPDEYSYWLEKDLASATQMRNELVTKIKEKKVKFKTSTQFEEGMFAACVDSMITDFDYDDTNPDFLNVTGILFREGDFKNRHFSNEELSRAKLLPKYGKKLCYVNFYHLREEPYRTGILTRVWWDPNQEWTCKETKVMKKGALMFQATITDQSAIHQVLNNSLWNVSAELEFLTDVQYNAMNIKVNGMGFTPSPAVPEAGINTICENGDKCYRIPHIKT